MELQESLLEDGRERFHYSNDTQDGLTWERFNQPLLTVKVEEEATSQGM